MATGQNGSVAPICPISRSQIPPGQKPLRIPVVPKAQDLPSVIRAINTITQILQQITNQFNVGAPAGNFVETGRSTTRVKVVNPLDNSQYIIFDRIDGIQFADQTTDQSIDFVRTP